MDPKLKSEIISVSASLSSSGVVSLILSIVAFFTLVVLAVIVGIQGLWAWFISGEFDASMLFVGTAFLACFMAVIYSIMMIGQSRRVRQVVFADELLSAQPFAHANRRLLILLICFAVLLLASMAETLRTSSTINDSIEAGLEDVVARTVLTMDDLRTPYNQLDAALQEVIQDEWLTPDDPSDSVFDSEFHFMNRGLVIIVIVMVIQLAILLPPLIVQAIALRRIRLLKDKATTILQQEEDSLAYLS